MLDKYLKDYLDEGGKFSGPLLVKSVEKGVTSTGSNYLTINFQDISSSIVAKKWEIKDDDLDIIQPNNVILVSGNIFKYKGSNQLKVESVSKMEVSEIDMDDFLIGCPLSSKQLESKLYELISLVKDEELKKLVIQVINENKEKYMNYPAAISVHHAYKSGIVYHSICIAEASVFFAKQYPQLNLDYLIVGSLLHDIGKTVEMNGVIASSYTLQGNLEGHINIGANIVEEVGKRIQISEDKLAIVVHIILSHHGEPEYGSSILPKTPEAYLIHMLDDIDSKMFILNNALKSIEVGEFSQRIPFLEGRSFLKTK